MRTRARGTHTHTHSPKTINKINSCEKPQLYMMGEQRIYIRGENPIKSMLTLLFCGGGGGTATIKHHLMFSGGSWCLYEENVCRCRYTFGAEYASQHTKVNIQYFHNKQFRNYRQRMITIAQQPLCVLYIYFIRRCGWRKGGREYT